MARVNKLVNFRRLRPATRAVVSAARQEGGDVVSALPFTAATDVVTLTISVDGTELPGTVPILGVEVVSQANRIPYARLRIGDGDSARGDFAAEQRRSVRAGRNRCRSAPAITARPRRCSAASCSANGVVVRRGSSWLEVGVPRRGVQDDAGSARTATSKSRATATSSETLLDDYSGDGVSAGDITATTVVHPQLLQYQATDWDFMISRLEAAGQICFVDGGKVSSVQTVAVGQAGGGARLRRDACSSSTPRSTRERRPAGVRALAWDPSGQSLLDVSAADPEWSGNGNLTRGQVERRRRPQRGSRSGTAAPRLRRTADRSRTARCCAPVSRRRADACAFQGLTAVKPGSVLTLSRLSDRFNGNVYVTGVRHEFSGGNWTTDAEFGLPRETHAERVAMSHLPAAGLAAAVHGLQVGIVTSWPTIRATSIAFASKSRSRAWTNRASGRASRRSTPAISAARCSVPRKDDEVVLGFFHGDPAQPVVLGMLHSSAKAPPITPTDDNDEKGYVSRSKMALRFDDKKKVAILETPGGNRLTLSDDDGGITLEDQNGNSIVLNNDGIALKSDKKAVTIKAKSDLKAEAMNAEIKATERRDGQGQQQGGDLEQRQPDRQGLDGHDQLTGREHMPPAARAGDMHVCPMVTGVVPHVGGPALPPGEPTVLIGGMPALRRGRHAHVHRTAGHRRRRAAAP